MFTALHPALLWGTAAVAIPVVIHLLLRQRPRPRPWAAMRWLLAAIQRAQRKWRLTNLLLLLLRCLVLLLAALAIARPSLGGLGRGGDLVLVIDVTASMGARGSEGGPLADLNAALDGADLPGQVTVVAIGRQARVVSQGGPQEALEALAHLAPEPMSGGLDRAAEDDAGAVVLSACRQTADVILASDFQQDDGGRILALLEGRVRSVRRWAVGGPGPNAAVAGITELPDVVPGLASPLLLDLIGTPTGPTRLAVDGGPQTPVGEGSRVALPPLDAGEHRLQIEIADQGLAYDNRLELTWVVRGPAPILLAQDHVDYLAAALQADSQHFAPANGAGSDPIILPSRLAVEGLHPRGVVALRGRSGADQRLRTWVEAGGVLWVGLETLRSEPAFAEIVASVTLGDPVPAEPLISHLPGLDPSFATVALTVPVHGITLPANAQPTLWNGATPLVCLLPLGRGRLIIEFADLAADPRFTACPVTPLWVRSVVRRALADIDTPRRWEAGTPAPEDANLRRAGLTWTAHQGEVIRCEPGCWTDDHGRSVIIFPNRGEARLEAPPPSGAARSVSEALPRRSGRDWGLPLLICTLLLLLCEGALAGWAGRTYGR